MMVNARWQFVLMYTAPAQAMAEAVEGVTAALLDRAIQVGRHAGLPLHHFPLEEAAAPTRRCLGLMLSAQGHV
jgi:NADPH2:quinone reductase